MASWIGRVVAVLLGALFDHETVTLRTLVAAILIIGSVALIITVQQLFKPMPPITAANSPTAVSAPTPLWRPPQRAAASTRSRSPP